MAILRLLFGLHAPINQKTYVVAGLLLAALKFGIDWLVVYLTTGKAWTLAAYLSPVLFMRSEAIRPAPEWVLWALVMYALPFAWIGLTMSVRRAADAGLTPWAGILFLIPGVNWLVILVLSLMPTRRNGEPFDWDAASKTSPVDLKSAILGISLGVLVVLGMVALSVFVLKNYGWSLFIGTPLVVGVLVGFLTNRENPRSKMSTIATAGISISIAGLATLLFAIEGIICILMAMPPAMIVATAGSLVGRAIAISNISRKANAAMTAVMFSLPILGGAETLDKDSPLYEVASTVEIDAPPSEVWHQVIHFSELPPPPKWVQSTGIAYPIRARLEGEGVGAVRHCEFSTGAFVEPITHWEEGVRLAFDVASQPRPMDEWSPYNHIHPPHLDGYLRSKRGEFRLIELPGGRTRLEGSTWYEVDISPRVYWSVITDSLIHRIHLRVLEHVKSEAEKAHKS